MDFRASDDAIGDKVPSPESDTLYYGWINVTACTILLAAAFGISYSFGIFFPSLESEFSWSRATTSSVFSLYLLMAGIFSIVAGWASDRYGITKTVIFMGAVSGLGLFLTSQAESSWQVFLTYGVLFSCGTGAIYYLAVSITVGWFPSKQSTTLGIVGSGTALGIIAIAPFSTYLIREYDWRDAYLVLSILTVAFMISMALFLKSNPSEIESGLHTDLKSPVDDEKIQSSTNDRFTVDTIKEKNFLLLLAVLISYSFSLHLVLSHFIPRTQDLGISPMKGAAILSVLALMIIPIRLLTSFIEQDGARKTIAIMFALMHSIALYWLIDADEIWMLCWFVILYGAAYGGIDLPITGLLSNYFAASRITPLLAILIIGWGFGAAAGPLFGGVIYDRAGGYEFAFFFAATIMVLASVCIWMFNAKKITDTPREHESSIDFDEPDFIETEH